MMFELIIGAVAFFYLIWKYVLSNKREQLEIQPIIGAQEDKIQEVIEDLSKHDNVKDKELVVECPQKVNTIEPQKIIEESLQSVKPKECYLEPIVDKLPIKSIEHGTLYTPSEPVKQVTKPDSETNGLKNKIKSDFSTNEYKSVEEPLIESTIDKPIILDSFNADIQVVPQIKPIELENVITPSQLLRQQKEKDINKTIPKRESPPKERFAEFLEKTVLSDDKIQSIIQNLSLDKTDAPKAEEFDILKETPIHNENKPLISERAVKLQESIDKIANKFKQLEDVKVNEEDHVETKQEDEPVIEETKPLLKRLQKQSGFPGGLNFGSVIGELKNKTKNASNGGLKPVFKKFDPDSDYSNQMRAQACYFFIY